MFFYDFARWQHCALWQAAADRGIWLSIRLLPNFVNKYFESEWINFDANWHKWCSGKGMKRYALELTRSKF